jgi:hypothetical protein
MPYLFPSSTFLTHHQKKSYSIIVKLMKHYLQFINILGNRPAMLVCWLSIVSVLCIVNKVCSVVTVRDSYQRLLNQKYVVSILFVTSKVWKQNCCLWCSLIMIFVHYEQYVFNNSVVNYICKHFVSCRWNWIVHLPIFTLTVHNIHMNIWDFNPFIAKSNAMHKNC